MHRGDLLLNLTILGDSLSRLNQAVLSADLAREAAQVISIVLESFLVVAVIRDYNGQLNIATASPPGTADNAVLKMDQCYGLLPDVPFSGPLALTDWGNNFINTGAKSATILPLTLKGESFGHLLAFSMDEIPPDEKMMQFFSKQVIVAAQRCRYYSRERQTFRQFQQVRTDLLHQQQAKDRLIKLQRQFTDASMLANGFEPLIETLGECLNIPLLLLDKSLRLLAAYTPSVLLEGSWIRTLEEGRLDPELLNRTTIRGGIRTLLGGESRAIHAEQILDSSGAVYWIAPLKSGNATWGFLFWCASPLPLTSEAEIILELARMSINMVYYQQCYESIKPTISFIGPLLTGQYISAEVIQETAVRLGCDLKRVTRLLLAEVGAFNLSEMQAIVEIVASSFEPGVYTAAFNGAIVLLLESSIDGKSLAKAVHERLSSALGGTITIGISRVLQGLNDIRTGYDELRRSLAIVQRLDKEGRVVAFDELGVYRILLSVDRSILEEITQRALGPLFMEGQKEELLSTLTSYIRSGGSPQQAAEECFIHLNTVKYRLKKLTQLLKIDLSNHDERFELDFALRALEVLKV